MAGDWIKMRSKLHDDPTVMRLMTATGLDRFAVVGRLHAYWSWTDEHADIDENGNAHVTGIALQHIDTLVAHPGFSDALVLVGWLEVDGDRGLNIPRYASHNGETAKKRAQVNKRVRRHRERINDDVTQLKRTERYESVTREEKRREEKKEAQPPVIHSPDSVGSRGAAALEGLRALSLQEAKIPGGPDTPAAILASVLFANGCKGTANHPLVVEWAQLGFTVEKLKTAIAKARQRPGKDRGPIDPAYLDTILHDESKPAAQFHAEKASNDAAKNIAKAQRQITEQRERARAAAPMPEHLRPKTVQ